MMGKRIRRERKRSCAAVILLLLLSAVCSACGADAEPSEPEPPAETRALEAESSIQNSEGLTLSSVYTSSIPNPDCGGKAANEIVSLEIQNDSQRYLRDARLTATMSDASAAHFLISDLPAGAIVEAFAVENTSLAAGVSCVSVSCDSEEFLEGDLLMTDRLTVTAGDTGAVLTNIGGDPLENLTVVYRCDMGGRYFGGISYETTIVNLAPGADCEISDPALFGKLLVVRVYSK